jgi:hypothetical protein
MPDGHCSDWTYRADRLKEGLYVVQERPGCGAEPAVRPVGRGEGSPAHPLRDGQEHHRFVLLGHFFRDSIGICGTFWILVKRPISGSQATENARH